MSVFNYIRKLYRGLRLVYYAGARAYSWPITCFKFHLNGVKFHSDFIGFGIPILDVNLKGSFTVGRKFRFNSGKYHAMGGRQQQCYFVVAKGGRLSIGDNVRVTSVALICHNQISIGDNVMMGINTVIYDTDFHSLNPKMRNGYPERIDGVKTKPVIIHNGAFIGGHTTILKGVTIGQNAIIGAGSVVFQDVPAEQVWAGNPARYVRDTYSYEHATV